MAIYFVVLNLLILKNEFNFNLGFNSWLNIIILVGIVEELVFRGFLLKKLTETYTFWKANMVTSSLFVSIHFPIWFYKGLFETPSIFNAIFTVFIIGFIFGVIYKRTNSLWSVIIIHSMYNLFLSIFH
ncbi:CPBP family intramembrane glutamic endopeptidase [Ornithinibacillus salinisoli]|uniref:CPBP family intramembrane glutamic endopeptidase n=2 Tax=Ornithinibacillus salinisoli TaxID=1848459 RepID=A0ABW4W3Y3_9BACI